MSSLCVFFIFKYRFRHRYRFKSTGLAPVSEKTQTIPIPNPELTRYQHTDVYFLKGPVCSDLAPSGGEIADHNQLKLPCVAHVAVTS